MAIGCPAILGLTAIFFGVLFLLENLGVRDGLVRDFWPVALIIVGVLSIVNVRRYRIRYRAAPGGDGRLIRGPNPVSRVWLNRSVPISAFSSEDSAHLLTDNVFGITIIPINLFTLFDFICLRREFR